jgi:hypothetical protein
VSGELNTIPVKRLMMKRSLRSFSLILWGLLTATLVHPDTLPDQRGAKEIQNSLAWRDEGKCCGTILFSEAGSSELKEPGLSWL